MSSVIETCDDAVESPPTGPSSRVPPRDNGGWEMSLEELSVMTRTKFGLNNRVPRLEMKSGEMQRVIVDKVELWIDAIYGAVNATGVVQMVETEPDRWVVS